MKSRLLAVLSFTLMSDLLRSAIPPSCFRVYSVLVCKKLNFRLEQIYSAVMHEVIIDFVFLNNTRVPCNCKIIELVKMLRVTDVIMVTMSPCTLERLVACDVDPVVPNPEVVAGLVVSRQDPRRNWAIKHHVNNLWYKIRSLDHAELRSFFYNSIIKDIREQLKRMQEEPQQNVPDRTVRPLVQDIKLSHTESPTTTTATTTTTTVSSEPTTTRVLVLTPSSRWVTAWDDTPFRGIYRVRHRKISTTQRRGRGRARGKRDNVRLRTRFINNVRFDITGEIRDNKILHTVNGSFPISSNQSSLFIAGTHRKKRQTWFASVVPYLAFAGGEYYSLYDPESIRLAVSRSAQLPPLNKKSRSPKRNFPTSKPVARDDSGTLVTTQPGGQLSPAEIRRMTRESDHRMKSFIIFFVAITGIITVIAVLLIMAMKSTGDTRGRRRYRKLHAKCQCCDERRQEQECLLNEYEASMQKRCPLFHYYQGAEQPHLCTQCLMLQAAVKPEMAGPNEKATQTEGKCHPIFGGRHVVTEFEAWCHDHTATYKPPGFTYAPVPGQTNNDLASDPADRNPRMKNSTALPRIKDTNKNASRVGDNNNSSPLVSFLDSIVKEKDGIMREHHRDRFNVKRRQKPYQPCLHADVTPASRRASNRDNGRRRKSLLRTSSSSDTMEAETGQVTSDDRDTSSNNNCLQFTERDDPNPKAARVVFRR